MTEAAHELTLSRLIQAPRIAVWRCWTEPELIIRTREGKIHPEYSAVKLAIGFPP